jgi:hypothetical protein
MSRPGLPVAMAARRRSIRALGRTATVTVRPTRAARPGEASHGATQETGHRHFT